MHVNYIRVSLAEAYVRPLLDRNNKNKNPPEPTLTVNQWTGTPREYVIHIAYLYILLYYTYKKGCKIYFAAYRCAARKKMDRKTLRVERINGL